MSHHIQIHCYAQNATVLAMGIHPRRQDHHQQSQDYSGFVQGWLLRHLNPLDLWLLEHGFVLVWVALLPWCIAQPTKHAIVVAFTTPVLFYAFAT